MILTRSPYYIHVPINYPTTTTSVTLRLYIWSGLQASVPATANYTITKNVPSTSTSELTFNISNKVNDYLWQTNVSASATSLITTTTTHSVWVYYSVEYTDGTETIADLTGTILASEGYGTYLDGYNPDIPANKILLDGDTFQISRTGSFCIPFLNDGTYTSITVNEDGALTDTLTPSGSTNSDNIINYVWIEGSEFTGSNITVVFGANTIYLELVDEYKYTPKDICFINKYGFQQIIPFFKKMVETLKVDSGNTFKNNYVTNQTYDTSRHQTKVLNKNAGKDFSLVSGFYEEENNQHFEQLLLSEQVWLLENEVFIPVNVDRKQMQYKTQVNDKLFGYNIDFSYAFDLINTV